MKKIVAVIVVAMTWTSCSEKKAETQTQNTIDSSGVFVDEVSVTDSTLVTSTTCYLQVTGKDSLIAQIDDNLGTVTGKLFYNNFEKDSSFGTLIGSVSGDTIKVEYDFEAEGTRSLRELWFLKKDGKLVEGIGPYDKSGERFSSAKEVKFEGGHVLSPMDCEQAEKHFKKIGL